MLDIPSVDDLDVIPSNPVGADTARSTANGSRGSQGLPRLAGSPAKLAEQKQKPSSQGASKPVEHRPRMPTHLERKMQDARKAFNRKLEEESDPNSPASPARLLRMLSQIEAVAQRLPKARRSQSARLPAAAQMSHTGPAAAHPSRSSTMPKAGQTVQAQSSAAVISMDGTAAGNHKEPPAAHDHAAAKASQIDLWGRGRATPHINLGLSILPTATQDLERDKTLYYSPIGGLASMSPHQYSKTLREGMLMYFSPSKTLFQLQSWARMDDYLQQQLEADLKHLPTAGSTTGVQSDSQQEPSTARHPPNLNFEQWMQGLRSGIGYVGEGDLVSKRIEALAARLDVHPNDLWDLLNKGATSATHSSSQPGTQVEDSQGDAGLSQAAADNPPAHGKAVLKTDPKSLPRHRSGLSRAKNVSHARLISILKRAPVAEADSLPRTCRPKRTAQPLIKSALTGARHLKHSLTGTPLTLNMMYNQQRKAGAVLGGADQHTPVQPLLQAPGSFPPPQSHDTTQQTVGCAQAIQCSNTAGDQTVAPPRSRCVSPNTAQRPQAQAGRQSSPTRARSPNAHQSGTDGGSMSTRYAEAARAGEWQPAAPGAIRPGTGESWDYTVGVQNKQLAQELFHQQLEQTKQQAACSLPTSDQVVATDSCTPAQVMPHGAGPLQDASKSVSPDSPARKHPHAPQLPSHSMNKKDAASKHVDATAASPEKPTKQHVDIRALRARVGRDIIRSVLKRAQRHPTAATASQVTPVQIIYEVEGLASKFGVKLPPAEPTVVDTVEAQPQPATVKKSDQPANVASASNLAAVPALPDISLAKHLSATSGLTTSLVDAALQRLHQRGGADHKALPGQLNSAGGDSTPRGGYQHAKGAAAPLLAFQSKTLSQSPVVLSQVQDVRHVKHVLWAAERELVPIVHRRRQQNATALLLP